MPFFIFAFCFKHCKQVLKNLFGVSGETYLFAAEVRTKLMSYHRHLFSL